MIQVLDQTGRKRTWTLVSALPLPYCVALGKSLHLLPFPLPRSVLSVFAVRLLCTSPCCDGSLQVSVMQVIGDKILIAYL